MSATVKTTYGILRGLQERGVHAFLGIPYAAPPVGPRRYAAPERPARWDGERPATRFGAVFQYDPAGAFDGHFVATQAPAAIADWKAFLTSLAAGAPAVP